MTSNIGAETIQQEFEGLTDTNREEVISTTKGKVFEILKKSIRPEFLNRIDEVIMFNPLSRNEIKQIVEIQFNGLISMLKPQGIHLEITDSAIDWLSQLGFDPQFGARPLKRVMQRRILNELSKKILAGDVSRDDKIVIDLNENIHEFLFTNMKPEVIL
jgi:ATP-dependent Clp protease ATP-binding subunit ClpB